MAAVEKRTWTTASGKVSSGYRVRFTDAKGKRRERNFKRKAQAQLFCDSLQDYRKKLDLFENGQQSMSFERAAAVFVEACRIGRDGGHPLRENTIENYEWRIQHKLKPIFGGKPIGSITRADVIAGRDTLMATGARTQGRANLVLLKAIFTHAAAVGIIQSSPADGIVIRQSRLTNIEHGVSIHTKEEMKKILAAGRALAEGSTTRQHWQRLDLMLNVLVFAGLRLSELRGLRADAVDVKTSTLKITQSADRSGRLNAPKSRSGYRTIHIPRTLAERLKTHCADKEELAFPTRSGRPMDPQNIIKNMWKRVQEVAGVRYLNLHSARHFFASMLIEQNVNLKFLQDQMGHSDPMFTLRVYGHLFRSDAEIALRSEMAERMAAALNEDDDE